MLEPVDIRTCWPRVKDFIERVLAKLPPQDYKPEDIYAACVTGQASAYMPDDDREGVIIMRLDENPFTGARFLFVWLAYSPDHDAAEVFGEEVEEIARKHGCSYIQFESARRGWQRKGWKIHNIIYRKEV